MVLLPTGLYAQQALSVEGRISDDGGEPLAGAMVLVQGQGGVPKATAMADINGYYKINCTTTDVLEFRYLGMKDVEENVSGRARINVVMEPDVTMALDEAVAIGYGSVRHEDLTGSVSNIKMADIRESPLTSVDQALQGKVAGADIMTTTGEPGATTSIRIRGTRSIEASNEPLIVVDGIMDAVSDLNDINPADIEDISVLKDASSTAIYGARGANGVILITTKASSSQASSKPSITFKATAGISQLPFKPDIMNATEFAIYRNDYAYFRNQYSSTLPVSSMSVPDPFSYGEGTDWIDQITQVAPYQSYYLSASGGSAATKYFFSASYTDNEGIIKKTGEKRFTDTFSINHQLFKWLKVGYKMSFTYRRTENPLTKIGGTGWWNSAMYLSPIIGPRDNYNPLYFNGGVINTPLSVIENETDFCRRFTNSQTVWGEASLAPWLKLKLQYNFLQFDRQRFYYYQSSLPAKQGREGGDAYQEALPEYHHTFETSLTADKDFKGGHHIDAVAGFTGFILDYSRLSAKGSGYLVDDIAWNDMNAVLDKETYTVDSYARYKETASVLARVNYNYRKRYYLTVTGRVDGASNFADNRKWGFFPSASAKWNIHNEKFMSGAKDVDELSVRVSVGQTGNDAIGYFLSQAAMSSFSGYLIDGSRATSYRPSRISSPDLTWETTTLYNIGLTGKFFNNRISVTAEAYDSRTRDLLLNVSVPKSTGYSSVLQNLGVTSNKGLELTLDTRNIVTKNFSWSTTLTVSHNDQRVLDIGTEDFVSVYRSPNNNPYMMLGYVKGYPLNALWGFHYAGVWHNQEEVERNNITHAYAGQTASRTLGLPRYVDVNHDGVLNQSDLCYLGNADPYIYGGLNNTFRYKGFKLNMYWTYSLGGKIFNYTMFYMAGGIYTNQYRFMLNSWHPVRNPDSDIPRAGNYEVAVPSDFMVFDASYLRLQDLSLSYTLNLSRKTFLKDVVFTLSGNNLLLFKYYNGFDPDVSSDASGSKIRRMDVGAYPKARKIVFSVQLRY
ncbi:MAG: TonB-dependent receptor [Bacteroidales bacterium]|nr:TonB-dependent receptor [Bacteroidales bacterium]